MHNSYINSTLWSIRSKGSLSFSFNDYSNLLTERYDRTPLLSSSPASKCCTSSSSCCCCCCASFSIKTVAVNPRFLCVTRQSSLIQWSPFGRRLILGDGNRYIRRFPVYEVEEECYELPSYGRERYSRGSINRIRNGRYKCIYEEDSGERYRDVADADADADAVISFLSEEVSEECLRGKRGNRSSVKRVSYEKYGSECDGKSKKRVEVDRSSVNRVSYEKYGSECDRKNKKKVGVNRKSNYSNERCNDNGKDVESKRKETYCTECSGKTTPSVKVAWKERNDRESYGVKKRSDETGVLKSDSSYGRKEETKVCLRGDTDKERRRSTSGTSYYSFSSSGDVESDTEVQDKEVRFVEESSRYKEDSRKYKEDIYKERMEEGFKTYSNDRVRLKEVSGQKHAAAETGIRRDVREKSDKKLSGVSVGEIHTEEESSHVRSKAVRGNINNYAAGSSYHTQSDNEEAKLTSARNRDRRTRKHSAQISRHSETKKQEDINIHEIHVNDIQLTTQSQNQLNKEDKKTVDSGWERRFDSEHHERVGRDVNADNLRRRSEQVTEISENRYSANVRDYQTERLSESRIRTQDEDRYLIQSSVQGMQGQEQRTQEERTGQTPLRRKTEQISRKSESQDTNAKKAFLLQSESHVEYGKEQSSFSGSQLKEKSQQYVTDQNLVLGTNSRKGSSSASVSHRDDKTMLRESQRTTEKRYTGKESSVLSAVQPMEESRESHATIDGQVVQTNLRKGDHGPSWSLSSHDKASSSQASLTFINQTNIQNVSIKEENSSLQAILMPPPLQSVDNRLLRDTQSKVTTSQEVAYETSESDSEALHTQLKRRSPSSRRQFYGGDGTNVPSADTLRLASHEDALGSAHRQEQSSMEVIGDFMQKVGHEVSTSRIQKEKNRFDSELASEVEKISVDNSSGTAQLKRIDSKPSSSRSSKAKGPREEMWVTDSSVQENPKTEATMTNTATGDSVVKRTGATLWSIIADVVRLRWGSRSATTNSAKSGKKSPSNASVAETWFSGHEPDDNIDDNAKIEKKDVPQEATPLRRLEGGQSSSQSQAEESETTPKEKIENYGLVQVSPSGISDSEFWPSLPANKYVSRNEQERRLHDPRVETDAVELSLPEAKSLRRSPVVKEVSEKRQVNTSGGGLTEQVEQPLRTGSVEEPESPKNDAVLKQRKLQRNKQVIRDRFDDWEEAYQLETEQQKIDEMFMREALLEAQKAGDIWEVPVGAVLVQDGKIIARGYNLVEKLRDSTAHAEMICIREASNLLKSWRLGDTTLYVTLEPCPMCAGAILQARIKSLVWGAPNKLLGADGSWIRLFPDGEGNGSDKPAAPVHPFHPNMNIRRGVLASECADAMQQFFQLRRRKKEKSPELPPTPPSHNSSSSNPSKIISKMHHIFHVLFCL